jgi:hypothetical protein
VTRYVGAVSTAAIAVMVAVPAVAQEPTQSEMAVARRLFRAGLAAARAGDWEQALREFERSYAVAEVPVTLFNLAGAQVQNGQLVAAMESYQRFLPQATTGRARAYRSAAEEAVARLEPRVPHVRITATGARPGDELRIDGETTSLGVLDTDLPLDPGDHSIALARDGLVVASTDISLAEADRREIVLEAGAIPSVDGSAVDHGSGGDILSVDTDEDGHEGGGLLSSPWFWAAVGAVVAGGVVAAILVAGGGDDDLYSGNVGPGRVTY